MSIRQRNWARIAREKLFDELGRKCALCGTTENLTFDCIVPQGDRHHKIEWSARISFYRRQHRDNNIQILCSVCNYGKSIGEHPRQNKNGTAV